MSPLRMFVTVLLLALAGSTLAAWEWLTGPVIPRPAPTALLSAGSEPDYEAQLGMLQQRLERYDKGLAEVRQRLDRHAESLAEVGRIADTAQNSANAREAAHARLEAAHYRLASEVATLSKEAPRREPRATAKARRAAPKTADCAPGGKRP